MSQLINMKEQIDAGWTAKRIISGRVITITVRIKMSKHEGVPCYVWQHYTEGHRLYDSTNPQTELHPTWGALLDAIEGEQTQSVDWELCRDRLMDYLPPERKQVPEPDKQTPL